MTWLDGATAVVRNSHERLALNRGFRPMCETPQLRGGRPRRATPGSVSNPDPVLLRTTPPRCGGSSLPSTSTLRERPPTRKLVNAPTPGAKEAKGNPGGTPKASSTRPARRGSADFLGRLSPPARPGTREPGYSGGGSRSKSQRPTTPVAAVSAPGLVQPPPKRENGQAVSKTVQLERSARYTRPAVFYRKCSAAATRIK